jgi:hypothetical protein
LNDPVPGFNLQIDRVKHALLTAEQGVDSDYLRYNSLFKKMFSKAGSERHLLKEHGKK